MDPLAVPDLLRRATDPAETGWKPFRPGVDMLPLYDAGAGRKAALLRYQPGASVPRHGHPGFEHVLVLAGSQIDERGTYRAGTFVVNPAGSSHAVTSPDGCVVLVMWERGIAFEA